MNPDQNGSQKPVLVAQGKLLGRRRPQKQGQGNRGDDAWIGSPAAVSKMGTSGLVPIQYVEKTHEAPSSSSRLVPQSAGPCLVLSVTVADTRSDPGTHPAGWRWR